MKQTWKPLSFVLCLMLVLASTASSAEAPALEQDDLTTRTIELHLSKASVMDVLNVLSVEHRVPLGLEHSSADKYEPKLTIDVKKTALKEVLDLIVQQEPNYRWEVRDSVINFVPTQGKDQFLETLLRTRISRFAPKTGINKFELRNTLADLPEVRRVLEANRVTVLRVSDYAYYPSIYSNKEVDLSISETDVRGVLNKIARDSEHNLWVLGWRDKKKRTLALGF